MKTVSYKIAKGIHDAGIVFENSSFRFNGDRCLVYKTENGYALCNLAAPGISEITDLLPDEVYFFRDGDGWNSECVRVDVNKAFDALQSASTLADCAGKTLIWLHKAGLLRDGEMC